MTSRKSLLATSLVYASANPFVLKSSSPHSFLSVNAGTLTTGVKFHNGNATTGSTAFSTLTLSNGGTLKLAADIADLFTTAGAGNRVVLGTGGGIVDTNGSSATLLPSFQPHALALRQLGAHLDLAVVKGLQLLGREGG